MTSAVEAVARAIFDHWNFQDEGIMIVPWVENGNSIKQTEARYYATAAIDTLTALNWLSPEAAERLLKHQHDIIGAQAASLEKAELEVERLSTTIPPEAVAAVERAAMERAANACNSRAEMYAEKASGEDAFAPNACNRFDLHTSNYMAVLHDAAAILAIAPSNSTWREVKEGWDVTPKEPTPEMTSAGIESDDKRTGGETCNHIFRHMIAARPRP